jgi:hypothetical protein
MVGLLAFVTMGCDTVGSSENALRIDEDGPGQLESLDAELRSRITQDYFNQVITPNYGATLEDLEVKKKYGVFDGHVVVGFNRVFVTPGMRFVEIGGVEICWELASFTIIAWKDGQVYTLISAQENNILSQASLREIALADHTSLYMM